MAEERLTRSEHLAQLGRMAASLAHEIRNPLVSAGGFARRLLSSMNPSDPNREKVEKATSKVLGKIPSAAKISF